MKNILFLVDRFDTGGVLTFIEQYTHIIKHKHQVFLLGLKGNFHNLSKKFNGCHIISLKNVPTRKMYHPRIIIRFLNTLNKLFSEQKIDIIHLSLTWSSLYCIIHPKSRSITKVFTFYGAYHLESASSQNEHTTIQLAKLKIQKTLQHYILSKSDIIVTFSQYSKHLLKTEFSKTIADKTIIIPGFTTPKKSLPQKFTSKKLRIVNFGRAERRKGINTLLQAIRILVDQGIHVEATIASPSDYHRWFDHLITYESLNLFKHVHFLHQVNDEQKTTLLSNADVFVIPSANYETFGMTIIESMSYGIPVIGTPIGAIPEILNLVDKRLICDQPEARSLAKTLAWFQKLSPQRKRALSKKSYQIANQYFSINKLSPQIMKLYQKQTCFK